MVSGRLKLTHISVAIGLLVIVGLCSSLLTFSVTQRESDLDLANVLLYDLEVELALIDRVDGSHLPSVISVHEKPE